MSDQDDSVDRDTAKLWTAHRELASVVWGDDVTRGNGLRSNVREQEKRLKAVELVVRNLITDLKHYRDKEREETCLGKKLIVAHEAKHKEGEEEEVEMKETKMTLKATIQAVVTIAMILFANAQTPSTTSVGLLGACNRNTGITTPLNLVNAIAIGRWK